MSSSNSPTMQRSVSMPAQPEPLQTKPMKRSQEKETLVEEDYYPESPSSERRNKSLTDTRDHLGSGSQSANNFLTTEWAGSTIELNSDLRRNEVDTFYYRRKPYRVIEKNGRENVSFKKIPEKSWRYIRDFVTTLIELDWKYMLTMFIGSYFLSWTFFAILCYMVAFSHGDLMFDEVTGERLGEGKDPCIIGVYDFTSMFIYSIETQTTIGFGEKYPSEECPETMFLFILQIIVSIAIEGGMISIIYAKTARPAKQLTKLKFSDKAVICHRDGKLCLLFRVCDPREQQTIESKIRVYMIIDKPTKEGELLKTHTELKLENKGQQIIVWPEIVCHVIDETSPLAHFKCAKDVTNAQFELYVSIVGVSAATAQVTEARTSYVPREIFWGQRFINIIKYDSLNERYVIDYGNFNTTISVDMTTQDLDRIEEIE
ncbi:ATP-sensitive inward rectifier potassium channel 12 [Lucilia sericata]|uniref:ATP-sensitive inward rectifier potassium channel 12 n=1 Tax=Lucilia sericata TaxID=13632 RepID=UPI0018A84944|nr:ATP-sensitive inward rectifier potassium channel 12 [Lucilia sericata]